MKFERGFKTWAERTSLSVRRDLGLGPSAPLAPNKLARHLGIALCTPEEISGLSRESRAQLLAGDREGWSAVTCKAGDGLLIIYNSAHAPTRQSSDIMHELAHILLNHSPGRMILSQDGGIVLRSHDPREEAEADWLAATLLLPREMLLEKVVTGASVEELCGSFCVSRRLLDWRLNSTGVVVQAKRMRKWRTS